MDAEKRRGVRREFHRVVNLTPAALERWLRTPESRAAGRHPGGGESIGHASGRRIVKLLRRRKSELSEDDYSHMRKVVGYVNRHRAQRPKGDVSDSRWRYSLMNWGHDPLKKGKARKG